MAVIALAWYEPDQYPALAAAAPDVPRTFDEFVALAGGRFDALIARGVPLLKQVVDVPELLAWCSHTGRPPDAAARSAFVAYVATRRARAH
ncbi:MAG TPA: hypothetical protein VFC56_06420 [Stellaceae bacterium]|nr:hypothetical protein [Stellaceae bacterium]